VTEEYLGIHPRETSRGTPRGSTDIRKFFELTEPSSSLSLTSFTYETSLMNEGRLEFGLNDWFSLSIAISLTIDWDRFELVEA